MKDTYQTPLGTLEISPMGHAGIYMRLNELNIYVDPYTEVADYTSMPPADVLLITHEHFDHMDKVAISCILTCDTKIISTQAVADEIDVDTVLSNGDSTTVFDIKVTAVPSYNIKHHNASGALFHPKGRGNGYVLSFGNFNVYVAGDTEIIPEMEALKNKIEIAFLPLCLPFTMGIEMWEDAVRMIKPKTVYPYHCTEVDVTALQRALPDTKIIA